jgi:hypothetical protein
MTHCDRDTELLTGSHRIWGKEDVKAKRLA